MDKFIERVTSRIDIKDLTWRCEICGKERPDAKISIISYKLKNFSLATRNLKYCNDNKECINAAEVKAKSGLL